MNHPRLQFASDEDDDDDSMKWMSESSSSSSDDEAERAGGFIYTADYFLKKYVQVLLWLIVAACTLVPRLPVSLMA